MRRTWIAALCAMAACARPDADSGGEADLSACDAAGGEQVLVARKLLVARADENLVSEGFDLDGVASGPSDPQGCGQIDYTDPHGVPGIDNALAKLMPVLETTEAVVLEPLIQDSINGGALLLMFGLTDLDDLGDDACVDVDLFKGLGIPMIGADGWLLPNQTLDVNPDTPITPAPTAPLIAGRLDAGPVETVTLAIQILDLDADVVIHDVQIRLEPQEDGTWTGLIAGGIDVQAIIDVITLQNVDDAVFALVGPVLEAIADLAPDETGACTQLSATLEFEAVPAFLFEE